MDQVFYSRKWSPGKKKWQNAFVGFGINKSYNPHFLFTVYAYQKITANVSVRSRLLSTEKSQFTVLHFSAHRVQLSYSVNSFSLSVPSVFLSFVPHCRIQSCDSRWKAIQNKRLMLQ